MAAARLLSKKSHVVPGKLLVSELVFGVPLDYTKPEGKSLRIYGRSVIRHDVPLTPPSGEEATKKSQKPYCVYLQGGPGFGCIPPQNHPATQFMLSKGYQMFYMDARGTGLSSTLTAQTLALQGDARAQAEYMKYFRADNIVRDAEAIRKTLTADFPPEMQKWSAMGQSFGGFCELTYLSMAPEGLSEVFMFGGMAPIDKTAEEVYTATFKKVQQRNEAFYNKYPEDVTVVQELAAFIESKGGIDLPSGGKLTVQRFLTMGMLFGFHGAIDDVHYLIYRMNADLEQFGFFTRPSLMTLENTPGFDANIIYAILHEALYCYKPGIASNWAAYRIGQSVKGFGWLGGKPGSPEALKKQLLYFSGEMIYPFMFEYYPELMELKEVADILAKTDDWPALYDFDQLAKNEVPVYSASYIDDMYVDFGLAMETVSKVKNVKTFMTNTMYHDAVRSKAEEVLGSLFAFREDVID